MLRTIFQIPLEVGGWPVFGFGLLFWAWLAFSAVLMVWLVRRQGWTADTQSYLPILAIVAVAIAFVFPRIAEADGLAIRGYGTMLVLATFAACGLAAYRARQIGLDPEVIYSLAFWLFLAGIGGARLFYVIQNYQQFRGESIVETVFKLVNFAEGGLVVYGSVIAASVAFVAFIAIRRLPALALLDVIAPSVALALGFGRIGCFLNGCCFGGVADVPWAGSSPADSPPWEHQVLEGDLYLHGLKFDRTASGAVIADVEPDSPAAAAGMHTGDRVVAVGERKVESGIDAHAALVRVYRGGAALDVYVAGDEAPRHWTLPVREWSHPIHPTQLYSSLNGFVLCLLLWAYYPFRRRDGEVIALLMTLYAITRFVIEIIRTDEGSFAGTGLTISQNISLGLLALAVALWITILSRPAGSAFPLSPQAACAGFRSSRTIGPPREYNTLGSSAGAPPRRRAQVGD